MNPFRDEKCLYDNHRADHPIQVFERADHRELRFGNYIVQSAQSLSDPDRLVLDYARAMTSAMVFRPEARDILHIGLGGGSISRFIHHFFPEVRQRVVEVDPEVVQVAHRFFGYPHSERLRLTIEEGAEFLATVPDRYDMIFLDAFHADGAPPHMNSPTVLGMAHGHLREGGWLLTNVWGSDRAALRRTVQVVTSLFTDVWSISVRVDSNVILIAGNPRRPVEQAVLRERASVLEHTIPLEFSYWVERLRHGPLPAE